MSVAEEIKRLHELHQAGALSDEEFAAAKARLLNKRSPGANDITRLRRSRTDRWLGGAAAWAHHRCRFVDLAPAVCAVCADLRLRSRDLHSALDLRSRRRTDWKLKNE
jgi:hypothetical protein